MSREARATASKRWVTRLSSTGHHCEGRGLSPCRCWACGWSLRRGHLLGAGVGPPASPGRQSSVAPLGVSDNVAKTRLCIVLLQTASGFCYVLKGVGGPDNDEGVGVGQGEPSPSRPCSRLWETWRRELGAGPREHKSEPRGLRQAGGAACGGAFGATD